MDYIDTFEAEDRARIFSFLATFSRLEFSLKKTGFVQSAPRTNQAEADWRKFAEAIAEALARVSEPTFLRARTYLLERPPQRLELVDGLLTWKPNRPRSRTEMSDSDYLLRIVRDVRNNLFHGGKYSGGPVADLARDRKLIDSASAVLRACLALDERVQDLFNEAA
jgi:hypothetical protein